MRTASGPPKLCSPEISHCDLGSRAWPCCASVTFRVDDLGSGASTFEDELDLFYSQLGVDGLFTDFPDRARAWLDSRR